MPKMNDTSKLKGKKLSALLDLINSGIPKSFLSKYAMQTRGLVLS